MKLNEEDAKRLVGLGLFTMVLFPGTVLAQDTCPGQCERVHTTCIDACGYFDCEEKCHRDRNDYVAACPAPSRSVHSQKDWRQPLWLLRLSSQAISSPQATAVSPVPPRRFCEFHSSDDKYMGSAHSQP
jgi:hypothetical protein